MEHVSKLYKVGNLVKLKEEFEDGLGEMVVFVTDIGVQGGRFFGGVIVLTGVDRDMNASHDDFFKSSFEKFDGIIELKGSV